MSNPPQKNRKAKKDSAAAFDQCQTPPYALGPLLPYIQQFKRIWEPACGEGYLVRGLEKFGHEVIGTDIIHGQNFFDYTLYKIDALVTNPPYSQQVMYPWIGRCYELGKPFALLMPVRAMGVASAQVYFEKYGVEVIWLNKRVNFKMPNKGWNKSSAQFPVAWYTWGLNIGQENTFGKLHIPKVSEDQLVFEGEGWR